MVRYETNDYSVPTEHGHQQVLVKAFVWEIVISCSSEAIARHSRSYGREELVFNPPHYLALLEQKSNAIRRHPCRASACRTSFLGEGLLGRASNRRLRMQKNRIDLAGYLATKPEARFLPSGTKVANTRLKESYRFTGSDGKQQTYSNWHSVVFYGELADIALLYEKDDNVYIEGSLQQRKFTPTDGVACTVYEVHARSCHQIASAQYQRQESTNNVREEEGSGYDDPLIPTRAIRHHLRPLLTD